MKNIPKQDAQNVYDYRNAADVERNNNYRHQNFPVNNDIEMNDFANPQNKRSDTIPLRKKYESAFSVYLIGSTTVNTRARSTWFENQIGLISSQIKDQMTPVTKYCCYLAGFFTFLIFLIFLKSL